MTALRASEATLTAPAHPEATLVDILRATFPRELSRPYTYPKRSFIYEQGGEITGVYCLLSGSVALERVDEDGRMAMFGVLEAGSLLGWQDVLAGRVHRNWAETLSPCDVAPIPRQTFADALHANARLAENLMRQGVAQLNAYEDHMLRLSTLELSRRLYSTLCSFAGSAAPRRGAVEFTMPLLKRDLAAMIGTSPESLSRSLRRLEELGVAEFLGKNVVRLMMGWDGESAA